MTELLTLYSVTLFWGAPDSDEGDYCNSTWAPSREQAIRNIAEEMGNSREKEFETEAERLAYVESLIAEAGPYVAEAVMDRTKQDLEMLLKGPNEKMTAQSQEDFEAICKILAKYQTPQ